MDSPKKRECSINLEVMDLDKINASKNVQSKKVKKQMAAKENLTMGSPKKQKCFIKLEVMDLDMIYASENVESREVETQMAAKDNFMMDNTTEQKGIVKLEATDLDTSDDSKNVESTELQYSELRKHMVAENKASEEKEAELRRKMALKSMAYLVEQSETYSRFFKQKLVDLDAEKEADAQARKVLETSATKKSKLSTGDNKSDTTQYADITKQLKYFEGGVLRQYQVEGVTWMTVLFENGLNGILADEMGLGKTIQVIALICHLYEKQVEGPYLIVVPLSTLSNWSDEFKRFAPKIPVVVFHGNVNERDSLKSKCFRVHKLQNRKVYPVVLTTYQMPLLDLQMLKQFKWQFIIVDEGHRLKNHCSKLSQNLASLKSVNRLLLTGTPLQNNITELWALLHFLLPFIFADLETFSALYALEDVQNNDKVLEQEETTNFISTIHKVLAPFMLRRLKSDVLKYLPPKKEVIVYCPFNETQKELYTFIIEKNIEGIQNVHNDKVSEGDDHPRKRRREVSGVKYMIDEESADGGSQESLKVKHAAYTSRITMQNSMSMLRKVVDHPYLIHFPIDPNFKKRTLLIDEKMLTESGKLMVLDAMLAGLKKRGHKVLIFSTFVMMLDIIEELMLFRNYTYCRLDGQSSLNERGDSIKQFNNSPHILAFLLSTRAGGLGLNLVGADTVIFVDRDWNPQVDIQAQDRCHRIGQQKPVVVYTLVHQGTIDDKVIQRGNLKRRLEKLVIKDGRFKSLVKDDSTRTDVDFLELKRLLMSTEDTCQRIHSNGYVFTDEELDQLLDRSDLQV